MFSRHYSLCNRYHPQTSTIAYFFTYFLSKNYSAVTISKVVLKQNSLFSKHYNLVIRYYSCPTEIAYFLQLSLKELCSYSKTMFLGLSRAYYWRFKCNTHNNYNYIIKTKWNYNWKSFTTGREAPSKVGLGLRYDRVS